MSEEVIEIAEETAVVESVETATETPEEIVVEVSEVVETPAEVVEPEPVVEEEISYHAVEKEGTVTAFWEMQGRKHLRTIDPRSSEGKQILALFETAA